MIVIHELMCTWAGDVQWPGQARWQVSYGHQTEASQSIYAQGERGSGLKLGLIFLPLTALPQASKQIP